MAQKSRVRVCRRFDDRVNRCVIDIETRQPDQECIAFRQRDVAGAFQSTAYAVEANCGAVVQVPLMLDQDRRIRYQGRVDSQFTFGSGVGLAQPAPKRNDLTIALDELLSGKEVSEPRTEAKGCLIGRAKQALAESNVSTNHARLIVRENELILEVLPTK